MQCDLYRNTLGALAGQNDMPHTSLTCPLHYSVPVLIERITVNMTMRIYHLFSNNLDNIIDNHNNYHLLSLVVLKVVIVV